MTPTPTPPPTAVPWATLTPYPTTAATAQIDFTGAGQDMAERLVQGYQITNAMGGVNMLMIAILLFLAVGGVWSIIRRLQSL